MINLNKINKEAPELLDIARTAAISLEKNKLAMARAKVGVMMDYSISMDSRYRSGEVQRVLNKVLPLALAWDDDGEIDFGVFDSSAQFLGTVNLGNYSNAVQELTSNRRMGSTNYAEAFTKTMEYYNLKPAPKKLFKKSEPVTSDIPVFMIFLTDGSPNSREAAVSALKEASHAPIFWKFISVGNESFDFLQKLDDLTGRLIDNADYKHLGNNIDDVPNDKLIDALLEEFNDWMVQAKTKGLLS